MVTALSRLRAIAAIAIAVVVIEGCSGGSSVAVPTSTAAVSPPTLPSVPQTTTTTRTTDEVPGLSTASFGTPAHVPARPFPVQGIVTDDLPITVPSIPSLTSVQVRVGNATITTTNDGGMFRTLVKFSSLAKGRQTLIIQEGFEDGTSIDLPYTLYVTSKIEPSPVTASTASTVSKFATFPFGPPQPASTAIPGGRIENPTVGYIPGNQGLPTTAQAISVNAAGEVVILDNANLRVLSVSPTDATVRQVGTIPGLSAASLVTDPRSGALWAVDPGFSRLVGVDTGAQIALPSIVHSFAPSTQYSIGVDGMLFITNDDNVQYSLGVLNTTTGFLDTGMALQVNLAQPRTWIHAGILYVQQNIDVAPVATTGCAEVLDAVTGPDGRVYVLCDVGGFSSPALTFHLLTVTGQAVVKTDLNLSVSFEMSNSVAVQGANVVVASTETAALSLLRVTNPGS
jgi:hypothetical protein